MPKTKVALTLDAALLDQVDALVAKQKFRNRSQAVEAALAESPPAYPNTFSKFSLHQISSV